MDHQVCVSSQVNVLARGIHYFSDVNIPQGSVTHDAFENFEVCWIFR